MDQTTTLLLIVVVVSLTIVMLIIGWQIVLILNEIRLFLKKGNTVVDHAVTMGSKISSSIGNLGGFGDGLRSAVSLVSMFKKKKEEEK